MNNTLQNGLMILEYLAQRADECSVKEIAEHFNLPNSHVCRLLKTLAESDYAIQTPGSRKYRISLKILTLSHARLQKLQLRIIARPYIQNLVNILKRPVFLTSNWSGKSLIIDVQYPDAFSGDAGLSIGMIHSVNRSACGKVCAAYIQDSVLLDKLISQCDWEKRTEFSQTDPELFKKELEKIRTEKFALMAGEACVGSGGAGSPIFSSSGEMIAAVGAVLPPDEKAWTPELMDKFKVNITSSAQSISFALGYPLNN